MDDVVPADAARRRPHPSVHVPRREHGADTVARRRARGRSRVGRGPEERQGASAASGSGRPRCRRGAGRSGRRAVRRTRRRATDSGRGYAGTLNTPLRSAAALKGPRYIRTIYNVRAMRAKLLGLGLVAALAVTCWTLGGRAAGKNDKNHDWPAYSGDKASTKYSPLDQIN